MAGRDITGQADTAPTALAADNAVHKTMTIIAAACCSGAMRSTMSHTAGTMTVEDNASEKPAKTIDIRRGVAVRATTRPNLAPAATQTRRATAQKIIRSPRRTAIPTAVFHGHSSFGDA